MELNEIKEDFNISLLSNISENQNTDIINNFGNNFENESIISSIDYSNDNSKEEEEEIIINTEKKHKKRNKDELNLTPLPLFSCIYCSNDKIAFSHLSKEIISDKYLFQTSYYDIQELNKLINDSLIEKDSQNDKLIKIIIEYSEYLKKFFTNEESEKYLKSNHYKLLCINNKNYIQQYFNNKLENSINRKKNEQIFKEIKIIPRNSNYNKSLFNTTNSLVNNIAAFNSQENNINPNKNNSLISDINFNSISLNYDNNYSANNNNIKLLNVYSIGMDFIVENIDKDSEEDEDDFLEFLRFDLRRKINHNDIIWEKKSFNIWNPIFCDDEEEEENEKGILYESKYLLHKNSTYSLQLNHKNKINDSVNLNNHHNQHLNLSSKQRTKNKIKTEKLDKLLKEKVDYIEKINRENNSVNKNLNKTVLKLKDLTNEINSKNQGSTQYESKFSNISNNKNSFLDKNQSSIFSINSFNLNSLLNQNLSQNYPSRLRKVFSMNKVNNNKRKNNKIKRKMENILDLINYESPSHKNLNIYENKRINSILSNSFQKLNIKTRENKFNSFFDN